MENEVGPTKEYVVLRRAKYHLTSKDEAELREDGIETGQVYRVFGRRYTEKRGILIALDKKDGTISRFYPISWFRKPIRSEMRNR